MTSQSLRIYTYKITFDEVPYYYYGVHKEKVFGKKYLGSPITHKWCWELYTPKKQILELFDFTDEGWIKAQEVEKRLIKPFYNDDKWCLNENCGGRFSLDVLRESGKIGGAKSHQLGVGIHGRTKEKMREDGKMIGAINGKKTYENGTGLFSLTKEETREKNIKGGKAGSQKNKENGLAIFALTKEQLSNQGKKTTSQKWMCLETGFITSAGNLVQYQRARGIDTSKRKRIS